MVINAVMGLQQGRQRTPADAACVTEDAKVLPSACLQSALAFRQRRLQTQTDLSDFASRSFLRTEDGSAACDRNDLGDLLIRRTFVASVVRVELEVRANPGVRSRSEVLLWSCVCCHSHVSVRLDFFFS